MMNSVGWKKTQTNLCKTKTMKNKMKMMAVAVAALTAATASVQAIQVAGTVTFAGTVTLNSGGTVAGATSVTAWGGPGGTPVVFSSSGNLTAPFLTPVAFTAPWTFGSGKVALWSYTGSNGDLYTFNLISSTPAIIGGSPLTLTSTGIGTIVATGPVPFDPTPGTWAFSTQDPSAGTPPTFSFSAATGSIPDGGMTVMLLGAALSGLCLIKRKMLA
jgi:hypothetical protein